MEWATGIGVKNGALVGHLLQTDGTVEVVPLAALAKRGVPGGGHTEVRLELDLHTAAAVPPALYVSAFGFHRRDAPAFRHVVYSFRRAYTEFLIPALVILRGLARPTRHVLPVLFGPQGLDQICHLDFSSRPPGVILDARWAYRSYQQRSGDLEQPLRWMKCFPTAMTMAASVHSLALEGNIAVEMPRARARMLVHGRRQGRCFLVTELSIIDVIAQEEPADFASGASPRILYRRPCSSAGRSTQGNEGTSDAVPLHPDDSVDVTDDEWSGIGPLLLTGVRTASIRLDQRAILNGILAKHAHNIPWELVAYRAGNANNARYAYRAWAKSGVYQRVLSVLRYSRRVLPPACSNDGSTDPLAVSPPA